MADSTSAETSAQPETHLLNNFARDLRAYWPLWLIVAAAVFLRLYEIHRLPGMHGDEAWYGVQARRLLAGELVEWRTPTSNVPGILQLGSLTLLHAIFPPSLLLLRLPVLISSLASMLLIYAIGRRFFGQGAAMTAVVLMACLPINIAYARLGWDPSHSTLLILASAYAAFAGRRLLCALFFALAMTNHPSAVFVAPFLTLAYLGFDFSSEGWRSSVIDTVKLVALLSLAVLLGIAISPATTHYVSLSAALSRLADPQGWAQFGVMFCRLLSGDTNYAYSVGVGLGSARAWADWAIGAGLTMTLVAGLVIVVRKSNWKVAGMLAGMIASLALLYLAAGKWALNPGLERFGYPMVSITALTVAAVVVPQKYWFQPLLALISLPMLASFWLHYVTPLKDGRTRQALGFWTGWQDPARSVFQLISADAQRSGARIIVEDWWLQMPISYYAVGAPFEVIDAGQSGGIETAESSGGTYWVTYGGSALDRSLGKRIRVQPRWTVHTTNRNDEIRIWKYSN